MDDLTLLMISFAFIVGFIFFILGLWELKKTFQEKDAASPAMGFIYFIISFAVWLPFSLWWFAMSTDQVLSNLGWLWFSFGWLNLGLSLTCIAFMLKASVNKSEGGALSLSFNEGAAT